MRASDKVKYGGIGAAILVVATALLLTTGWGQAAAATVTQVFVTNKGATQAVPVSVTNGSVAVSTKPLASTAWSVITGCTSACLVQGATTGASTFVGYYY